MEEIAPDKIWTLNLLNKIAQMSVKFSLAQCRILL